MAVQPGGDGYGGRAAVAHLPLSRRARGWQERGWHRTLTVALLAAALIGLAITAAGIARQVLPRRLTSAQQRQIMAWEVARRWQVIPAGEIFPARASYRVADPAIGWTGPLRLTAERAGLAPQASCRLSVDQAAARALARYGCRAVLRATYVDDSGSLVVTVGIAPMRSAAAARAAAAAIMAAAGEPRPGLLPARYPGTLAARFGAAQRQLTLAAQAGPYVVLTAAGFTDGQPQARLSADPYMTAEMTSFARGVAAAVAAPLSRAPAVPVCPGAPGC